MKGILVELEHQHILEQLSKILQVISKVLLSDNLFKIESLPFLLIILETESLLTQEHFQGLGLLHIQLLILEKDNPFTKEHILGLEHLIIS